MYRDIREVAKVEFGIPLLELTIPPGFVNFSVLNAFNSVIFFLLNCSAQCCITVTRDRGFGRKGTYNKGLFVATKVCLILPSNAKGCSASCFSFYCQYPVKETGVENKENH